LHVCHVVHQTNSMNHYLLRSSIRGMTQMLNRSRRGIRSADVDGLAARVNGESPGRPIEPLTLGSEPELSSSRASPSPSTPAPPTATTTSAAPTPTCHLASTRRCTLNCRNDLPHVPPSNRRSYLLENWWRSAP